MSDRYRAFAQIDPPKAVRGDIALLLELRKESGEVEKRSQGLICCGRRVRVVRVTKGHEVTRPIEIDYPGSDRDDEATLRCSDSQRDESLLLRYARQECMAPSVKRLTPQEEARQDEGNTSRDQRALHRFDPLAR